MGLLLLALAAGCSESVEPAAQLPEVHELTPAFVQLLDFSLPPGAPAPTSRPALHLSPGERQLRVSGWTEGPRTRRVEQSIPIPRGQPLAMCWRAAAELVVAVHEDDGDTLILGWTWDGERLEPSGAGPVFEGRAGIVISLEEDPRSGALVLLDGRHGRLLEVVGPTATRTLADTSTMPALASQRSLWISLDPSQGGAAIFTLSTKPPDTDTILPSDAWLQVRDMDAGDGQLEAR